MRIHVLQHVAFEGAGTILSWADCNGAEVNFTRFDEPGWYLPSVHEIDLLVVMGGPMSVHEESIYPWLPVEKSFLQDCIEARVHVMGICLGAQLLAEALGARVYAGEHKEIGWLPVRMNLVAHRLLEGFPEAPVVFHWHGDTFDLPPGAIRLASSEVYENQAFIWNDRVLGLQFHLEVTAGDIDTMIDNVGHELDAAGRYVQSSQHIMQGEHQAGIMIPLLEKLLDRFTS